MAELRRRARALVERTPPGESSGENLVAEFLTGHPSGDYLYKLLVEGSYSSARWRAQNHTGDAKVYYDDLADILKGIMLELFGKLPK